MDWALISVYILVGIISLCFFILVIIIGGLILYFSKRDIESRYEFLKNMVYGAFGGIIASIFIDLRGTDWLNIYFWIIKVPLTLLAVGIFILLGFLYQFILDRIFHHIKSLK